MNESARTTSTRDDALTQRIDELLESMTVAEKAAQLTQYFHFSNLPQPDARDGAVQQSDGGDAATNDGTVAALGVSADQSAQAEAALARGEVGSMLFVTDPTEINRLQRAAIDASRHGIPLLFGYDVIHGLRTIMPVPIAMAASWDPAMIERAQAVAAREARAVGLHWTFSPMVDIARDPRWGRMVEGAGEDPFLGSVVAAAQVRGLQGECIGAADHVIAGPKHFIGYGAAIGGRDYDEVDLSESQLWNVYAPPFIAAFGAGAGNVMSAYMGLNGVPATGNNWLFTEVLRDRLGFTGFAVSDANAVRSLVTHDFAVDLLDAAARALNAGVDMEMAIGDPAYAHLPEVIEAGTVDERTLDASVRRVLEVKIRMGLFDDPYVDVDAAAGTLADPSHRDIAQVAAERSAVLLRNERDLLPLDVSALRSIAVIGPLADSKRDTLGPWAFDFDLDETVTVLDGIRAYVEDEVDIVHAAGIRPPTRHFPSMFEELGDIPPAVPSGFDDDAELTRAVTAARDADVAVIVLGEGQLMIGENASRSSLELPGRQLEMLQAVTATETPTVLLVMSGRPLDLRWADRHVPAIIEIWYPGSRGGTAVANLLFGDVSPGGKLPFTWPRSVGQVPLTYAHLTSHDPNNQHRRYWDEPSTPLFPFGHGLSYGKFDYGNLTIDRHTIAVDETVTVSVDVTNTGGRAGDEVVQLYLHQRHVVSSRPVRELKGFRRIALDAGASTTVMFSIGPAERRYWSAATRDWVLDVALFDVWVGGDSTATLATGFSVTGGRID